MEQKCVIDVVQLMRMALGGAQAHSRCSLDALVQNCTMEEMSMMDSPIQNRIGCVFIPVSDMTRARTWYERLLGLPPSSTSHADQIADLPMVGETRLILDSHKPVVNSSQPLLFFWTDDLRTTEQFLQQLTIDIVRPIEDIGSVSTLVIQDPDQNLLMICQRNPSDADTTTK